MARVGHVLSNTHARDHRPGTASDDDPIGARVGEVAERYDSRTAVANVEQARDGNRAGRRDRAA